MMIWWWIDDECVIFLHCELFIFTCHVTFVARCCMTVSGSMCTQLVAELHTALCACHSYTCPVAHNGPIISPSLTYISLADFMTYVCVYILTPSHGYHCIVHLALSQTSLVFTICLISIIQVMRYSFTVLRSTVSYYCVVHTARYGLCYCFMICYMSRRAFYSVWICIKYTSPYIKLNILNYTSAREVYLHRCADFIFCSVMFVLCTP